MFTISLRIVQYIPPMLQVAHQMDEGYMNDIPFCGKGRFSNEHLAHIHTEPATDQDAFSVPNLNGMGLATLVQGDGGIDPFRNEPRPLPVATSADNLFKGCIESHSVATRPNKFSPILFYPHFFRKKHHAGIAGKPLNRMLLIHGIDSLRISFQQCIFSQGSTNRQQTPWSFGCHPDRHEFPFRRRGIQFALAPYPAIAQLVAYF